MDWIMKFIFMIYLFSELLLRIHHVPHPALRKFWGAKVGGTHFAGKEFIV